jgi:hypothetical protein
MTSEDAMQQPMEVYLENWLKEQGCTKIRVESTQVGTFSQELRDKLVERAGCWINGIQPDLAGIYLNSAGEEKVFIIELKYNQFDSQPRISAKDHLFQARMYGEVFRADWVGFVDVQNMGATMKSILFDAPKLLRYRGKERSFKVSRMKRILSFLTKRGHYINYLKFLVSAGFLIPILFWDLSYSVIPALLMAIVTLLSLSNLQAILEVARKDENEIDTEYSIGNIHIATMQTDSNGNPLPSMVGQFWPRNPMI